VILSLENTAEYRRVPFKHGGIKEISLQTGRNTGGITNMVEKEV
jgi:hypothetical protein